MPLFPSKPRPGDLVWPDVTVPVEALIRSHPGDRSPERLCALAEQFGTGWSPPNPRYVPHDSDGRPATIETHCDRYVNDVCDAAGVILPAIWRGRELSANGTLDWLAGEGVGYEWAPVSMHQACAFADEGQIVIVGWRNPGPGSGHVAIVLPSPLGTLRIAQAGKRCFFDRPLAEGFGTHGPLLFFAHA